MGEFLEDLLGRLRMHGWRVAVHNDYTLGSKSLTFWLFTHPHGVWARGEAETDCAAVRAATEYIVLNYPELIR